MKKINAVCLILGLIFFSLNKIHATPSTTFWTPAVMDIQPFKIVHLGMDNYSTIDKKIADGGSAFPTDYQITVGVLPFDKLQMEVGLDLMEPADFPVYFNAKIGTPENILFKNAPALNVGIFNVGTEKGVTDYNIADLIIGKTLPFNSGRLHLGGYSGNAVVLRDGNGNVDNTGYMIGYDKYLYQDKVQFAADYASGKNIIGGGGFGVYYFFTSKISLLTGPVWFNDIKINGDMKWTVQLDINL